MYKNFNQVDSTHHFFSLWDLTELHTFDKFFHYVTGVLPLSTPLSLPCHLIAKSCALHLSTEFIFVMTRAVQAVSSFWLSHYAPSAVLWGVATTGRRSGLSNLSVCRPPLCAEETVALVIIIQTMQLSLCPCNSGAKCLASMARPWTGTMSAY